MWEGRWRVIPHDVLPDWLKDNDFLLHGHRPPMPSFRACFRSIFRIHTETGNIWTHLLGGAHSCAIRETPVFNHITLHRLVWKFLSHNLASHKTGIDVRRNLWCLIFFFGVFLLYFTPVEQESWMTLSGAVVLIQNNSVAKAPLELDGFKLRCGSKLFVVSVYRFFFKLFFWTLGAMSVLAFWLSAPA